MTLAKGLIGLSPKKDQLKKEVLALASDQRMKLLEEGKI